MTKQEKYQLVAELSETLKVRPNFYIADTGGMTVAEVSGLRALCHKADVKMQVVKNTLFQKALEASDTDYSGVYDALKLTSAVFFPGGEALNVPAKVIKDFRKKNKKPILKAAFVEESVYHGDESLDALAALKSKNELIADVVALLQSPIKTVLSQLETGGSTIAGLVKTLSEREG